MACADPPSLSVQSPFSLCGAFGFSHASLVCALCLSGTIWSSGRGFCGHAGYNRLVRLGIRVVAYQGKEYLYNTDIKTYLMMGVDINGPVQQSSDYTQGGQSDALFLLVVNNKTEQLQVISINRNTMADIELCDEEGIDMGPLKTQICLQHAFGDGKRLSCSKTVDAVSGLFQNIPISGYRAMNMGGIPQMNDAVGGVEVTVLQDISFPKAVVDLKKGKKVTLDGTQAYYYLHGRDTEEYDSATKRLQREEQYIVAYMDKLKKVSTENPDQVTEIYNSVSDFPGHSL